MKPIFPIPVILCLAVSLSVAAWGQPCQHRYDTVTKRELYTYVNDMPTPPDGLLSGLSRHIQFKGDEGELFRRHVFELTVEADGLLTDIRVSGKKVDQVNTAEAAIIKAISTMPRWEAGKCSGKAVPVRYFLPVTLCAGN